MAAEPPVPAEGAGGATLYADRGKCGVLSTGHRSAWLTRATFMRDRHPEASLVKLEGRGEKVSLIQRILY
jgi:hypothetical protein